MGFAMSKVAANAVPMSLTFKGSTDVLKVVYRPAYYNSSTEKELDKVEKDRGAACRVYANLCLAIESWDAEDDAKKPISLTIEGLAAAKMPTRVCNEILVKCANEITVGELTAVSS